MFSSPESYTRQFTEELRPMPFSRLGRKRVTSAQVLALNATPITVVDAPGVGLALLPILFVVHKPAGVAYGGIAAGEDLAFKYTSGAGAVLAAIETTGFLDQTTVQTRVVRGNNSATPNTGLEEITPVANAVLVVQLLVGEITTGDQPLLIEVYGHVLNMVPLGF